MPIATRVSIRVFEQSAGYAVRVSACVSCCESSDAHAHDSLMSRKTTGLTILPSTTSFLRGCLDWQGILSSTSKRSAPNSRRAVWFELCLFDKSVLPDWKVFSPGFAQWASGHSVPTFPNSKCFRDGGQGVSTCIQIHWEITLHHLLKFDFFPWQRVAANWVCSVRILVQTGQFVKPFYRKGLPLAMDTAQVNLQTNVHVHTQAVFRTTHRFNRWLHV